MGDSAPPIPVAIWLKLHFARRGHGRQGGARQTHWGDRPRAALPRSETLRPGRRYWLWSPTSDRRQVVGLGGENRTDRLQKFRETCTHEHSRRE